MAVYVAARDLAGEVAFIGTHQFIIIVPDSGSTPPPPIKEANDMSIFPKNIENGTNQILTLN
ncbi:MAG: hypothetical protein GY820_11940 [Gammaproteobacteria bacterium]|nr:hypothetical protein [Gammaproteobacteria bacterium]